MIRQTEFVLLLMLYQGLFHVVVYYFGEKESIHYNKCFITEVYSLYRGVALTPQTNEGLRIQFVSCCSPPVVSWVDQKTETTDDQFSSVLHRFSNPCRKDEGR